MDDNNQLPYLLPKPKAGYLLSEIEEILLAYICPGRQHEVSDKGRTVIRLLPYSFSVN